MPVRRHHVSLVELIVALVLMGLLGALVAPYLRGVLRRTVEPAQQARAATALVQVAERISNDYEKNAALRSNLATLRTQIENSTYRAANYGSCDTAVCTYVRLDTGAEVAGTATDVLKVTLGNKGAVFVLLFPYRAP
jgi:type II secretory pathway pseudopilin PulG